MFSRSWMFCLSALVALALGVCACGRKGTEATPNTPEAQDGPSLKEGEIAITYYGHDAFLLANDVRIAIAPHDDRIGYGMDSIEADVVLTRQADLDQAKGVEGGPQIVAESGEHKVNGVTVRGVEAYAAVGTGIIYAFELEAVRFCHLGSLGGKLDAEQVKAIGPVDLLMIPVGGGTALDADGAWAVIGQLKPKMVLPMHYQTEKTKVELGLQPLDPFKELASEKDETGKPRAIALGGGHTMVVSKARLPTAVCILYALKPW